MADWGCLINFRKFLVFSEIHTCPVQMQCYICDAGWPKIWGPQDERCPISINDLLDMHNTAVLSRESVTALPQGGFFKGDMRDSEANWRRNAGTWKLRSEECNDFYRIESMENGADEWKTKFCAR